MTLFICLLNTDLVSAKLSPVYYGPLAGHYDNSNDSDNVGIGSSALLNNTYGGVNNTAVGSMSMYSSENGDNNTAVGSQSLFNITTGSSNTVVGVGAGGNITSGSSNIMIGYNVNAPLAASSNQLNIGNTIYGDLSVGNINIRNNVTAKKFIGDGSGLTNITANNAINAVNATNAINATNSINASKAVYASSLVAANNIEVVKAENSNLLRFSNTDYLKMFLLGSSSPTTTRNTGFAFVQSNDNGASSFSAPIYVGGIHLGGSYNATTVAPPVDGEIRTSDGTSIHLRPNNISQGTIFDQFGNVGIGINPTEKLTVNGNIKASKTMTDVLSLAPRTTPPVTAVAGDIYAYQSGTNIALCMYSGADWVKIGGTAVSCPRVNYICTP